MKKKKLLFLGSSILCLAISLFTINSIKNVGVSYAIEGIPNSDFSTNVSSTSATTINLVGDALGSSYDAGVKKSFEAIKDVKHSGYPLYVLTKNKYTPTTTETFEVNDETGNPTPIDDRGLIRILQVGYSNINHAKTVFNANNYGTVTESEKEYITQIAIWMYLYKNASNYSTYCANDGCTFFNTDSSAAIPYSNVEAALAAAINSNAKLKYVNDILTEADNSSIVLSSNPFIADKSGLSTYTFYDGYILTGEFKFNSVVQNEFVSYSVSVVDPNGYGIYLTDASGNKLGDGKNVSSLSSDTVVRLHIPTTGNLEDMDLRSSGLSYTVNTLYSNNHKAYSFRVTTTTNTEVPLIATGASKSESFSDVLFGSADLNSYPGDATLHNFTVISKKDATSQEEIGGARLEIYNNSDMTSEGTAHVDGATPIASWTSEAGKSHKLSLDNGTYGLCETVFPDGYGINEAGDQIPTCITFTVNNNTVTIQQMLNYPIPNTGLFSSKVSYTIGGALVIIGILGMALVLGKDKKRSNQQTEQKQQSM